MLNSLLYCSNTERSKLANIILFSLWGLLKNWKIDRLGKQTLELCDLFCWLLRFWRNKVLNIPYTFFYLSNLRLIVLSEWNNSSILSKTYWFLDNLIDFICRLYSSMSCAWRGHWLKCLIIVSINFRSRLLVLYSVKPFIIVTSNTLQTAKTKPCTWKIIFPIAISIPRLVKLLLLHLNRISFNLI